MDKVQDRRNELERQTHTTWIGGTDTFLSGWGEASKGASIAVWACRPEDKDTVLKWVNNRPDISHVFVKENVRKHRDMGNAAHVSIYVVGAEHPALKEIG